MNMCKTEQKKQPLYINVSPTEIESTGQPHGVPHCTNHVGFGMCVNKKAWCSTIVHTAIKADHKKNEVQQA